MARIDILFFLSLLWRPPEHTAMGNTEQGGSTKDFSISHGTMLDRSSKSAFFAATHTARTNSAHTATGLRPEAAHSLAQRLRRDLHERAVLCSASLIPNSFVRMCNWQAKETTAALSSNLSHMCDTSQLFQETGAGRTPWLEEL
jgi:hypothetical protein